ncbi:MAG: hypothetical protein BWK78_00785 [Thiotrichaceae bacterium IS1]|nr:MAG: hypothetical protein BWK78_00785 [Thiotrichaceae bacterium IS1]
MKTVLPNFFVVGAMKAGTTSLYNYLKVHPEIYMSPVKEPNYFATDINTRLIKPAYRVHPLAKNYLQGIMQEEVHISYITDFEYYMKLFQNVTTERIIGEASTSYLYSRQAPRNILNSVPNAKIVIILRDPIERAYSHYCMDVGTGLTQDFFLEAVKKDFNAKEKGWGITSLYIELGLYHEQVKRYLDLFPKEQVKVYLFDDLKTNLGEVLQDIAVFLNINASSFIKDGKRYNERQWPRFIGINYWLHKLYIKDFVRKILPRHFIEYGKNIYYSDRLIPSMSRKEVHYLQSLFKEDVKRLSELLNRDLSHWKTNGK